MGEYKELICPVCGHKKALADNGNDRKFDCEVCGFVNAYPAGFAGETSRMIWQKQAEAARENWRAARRRQLAAAGRFAAGSGGAAFQDEKTGQLFIVLADGRLQVEQNALQFSASERNYAVRCQDGRVKVFGEDNSCAQRDTEEWADVQYVLSAPNCTYGIRADGSVLVQGAPADVSVKSWKNMKKLVCGPGFVAGLREDGSVAAAGELAGQPAALAVEGWSGMTDIAAARDGILGLEAGGGVRFAGKSGDARAAAARWPQAIAIAIDNTYAVGLTPTGEVLLAGSCRPFLDQGRRQAAAWHHMTAICCTPSGIAALNENGELAFAGTVSGDLEKMQGVWNENVRSYAAFD